uniref:Cysteine-rich DPF motif domain-containing protein 1 n=1 Tax=Dunaliella tertiolecta TaxID=3047 RepID=A0A7S3QT54_DUNTE|mmetsp:Transcript_18/g.38  ORF Transcript_18/g.38 Transcript_18/m.38 type:complete len:116 (+) Transcript_18:148-495(+)
MVQTFQCELCGFSAPYQCKSRTLEAQEHLIKEDAPSRLVFLEDAYLVPDPSSAKLRPVALGSNCSICAKMVCCDCSLFYSKRFCIGCCKKEAGSFPTQLHKLAPRIFSNTDVRRS